ncbi:hypothetical protein HFN80_17215 [Rhizobium laguerreae]|uniref:hypothetical protein n=1 Tax=Rhizobium laguerreae TaxID=1076926 RepID=UPI001C90345D|nr:hypothetical protein [Rhizobium laguerreae]MBY3465728.1 hypothetical protein [Rhizobium laguerreae]
MFVKLTGGTITRWINMDAVVQMRFDEDKHQTELFLLRESARRNRPIATAEILL